MQKGFYVNLHPNEIQSFYGFVWVEAALGTQYQPDFHEKWAKINSFKRGIIFQPVLTADDDVSDNASFHLQVLQEHNPAWRNGVPVILDMWKAPLSNRLGFDQLMAYGGYIRDHWEVNPGEKVLLRTNVAQWNAWMKDYPILLKRVLSIFEPLLLRPDALVPGELDQFGAPAWWEYDFGLIKYESTKIWQAPIVETPDPIEEPQPEEVEPEPVEESVIEPVEKTGRHFYFNIGKWRIDITERV